MADEGDRPVIVAGVDGSDDSRQALRWAARQAWLTGAELRAVIAWHVPFTIYLTPSHTEGDYARDAGRILEDSVRQALGPDAGVTVTTRLVQDRPALALTGEARQAELLVVGSHGRGELPGIHLGSVASYCVHHASCPVTVVCCSPG